MATTNKAISGEEILARFEHANPSDLVLFIGDPHFKKDNVAQTEVYVEECVRIFKQCPPGTVCLIAGDVLDSHGVIHQKPMQRAINFFERLMQIGKLFVLVGNHDYITNQEYLSSNHWMCGVEKWPSRLITIVSKPIISNGIVFMPYVPPGRMLEALDGTLGRSTWMNSKCVFGHQEVYGVVHGNIASVSSDRWCSTYPPLVSGHIHTSQKIGKNVFYPGSVISHSFGECGDSAVHIINLAGDSGVDIQPIRISVPRRRTVVMDFDKIVSAIDEHVRLVRPTDDLERIRLRVRFTGSNNANDPRLKLFLKKLPENVKFIPHIENRIETRPDADDNDPRARKQFISFEDNLRSALNNAEPDVKSFILSLLNKS